MLTSSIKSAVHSARYFPLWSALTAIRWRSFDLRSRGLGTTFASVMRWYPPATRCFDREAKRVFPDMKRSDRAKLGQDMGRHMGRTLFEIYHQSEFQTQHHKFTVSGNGLAALKESQAIGRGAIIVSGHFGQWEAIRAAIKLHGLESGAVYRPHNNRHYARRILAGIEAGGKPIFATGRVGPGLLCATFGKVASFPSCWMKNMLRGSASRFLGLTPSPLYRPHSLPLNMICR